MALACWQPCFSFCLSKLTIGTTTCQNIFRYLTQRRRQEDPSPGTLVCAQTEETTSTEVRYVVLSRFENCGAFFGASSFPVDYSRTQVGIEYRSQCRNLQRGACIAVASASESRRRSVALPAPERRGHRRRRRNIFDLRDSGHWWRAEVNQGIGYIFRGRFYGRGSGHATRDSSRGGGWTLLRGNGPAPGAWRSADSGR